MGRGRMIDNKDTDILKPCESEFKCGNYFYSPSYRYCEQCRGKDYC